MTRTLQSRSRGILWFTVQVGNMVGRLDPQWKNRFEENGNGGARPYGIVINSKGIPFFCEFGTNSWAKIDPQSMAIVRIQAAESASRGALQWTRAIRFISRTIKAKSGPARSCDGAVKMCHLRAARTPVLRNRHHTDGMVWYSESGVKPNTLIQFNPGQTIRRAAIPSERHSAPHGGDGRRAVYIACSGVNKVGVVEPSLLKCLFPVPLLSRGGCDERTAANQRNSFVRESRLDEPCDRSAQAVLCDGAPNGSAALIFPTRLASVCARAGES